MSLATELGFPARILPLMHYCAILRTGAQSRRRSRANEISSLELWNRLPPPWLAASVIEVRGERYTRDASAFPQPTLSTQTKMGNERAGSSSGEGIRVNSNPLDLYRLLRPVLPIHLHPLHLPQGLEPLVAEHAPEHGIQAVEVRRLVEQDEELAAVCVGTLVGHGDDAARRVAEGRAELVGEGLVPDGAARLGVFGGRVGGPAGLDHEGGDEAVEGGAIVVAGGAEGEKVLCLGFLGSVRLYGQATGKGRWRKECEEEAHLCGLRDALAEDLDLDVPVGGVQCDGHGSLCGRRPRSRDTRGSRRASEHRRAAGWEWEFGGCVEVGLAAALKLSGAKELVLGALGRKFPRFRVLAE